MLDVGSRPKTIARKSRSPALTSRRTIGNLCFAKAIIG